MMVSSDTFVSATVGIGDTMVQWRRLCAFALIAPSMIERFINGLAVLAHRSCVLVVALGLSACGTLPPQGDRPVSQALAPSTDSPLVRIARESAPEPSSSAFRLMPLGLYSLDARIELTRRAQSSLDVQYYLIHHHRTRRLSMRRLR